MAAVLPWGRNSVAVRGSHVTPSVDWDYPVSFIMGIWAYVFAPWTVRAIVYRRWRAIPLALFFAWAGIDGVYSLYWWCRGFDALHLFRWANAAYSSPLYILLGLAMNIEFVIEPTDNSREDVAKP